MQNAAIIYMSREQDAPLLYHSLRLLVRNFLSKYNYPVIIFHDDLQRVTVSNIMVALSKEFGFTPNIRFEILKFTHPEGVSTDPSMYDPPLSRFWMGYRHMCRFFCGQVFNHPALKQYDWYLRLDSDSYLLTDIKYDVFEYMAQNNKKYAYVGEYRKDNPIVTVGLWETTKAFMKEKGITPKSMEGKLTNGEWAEDIFYTNFEIVNLPFFRGEEYTSYFQALEETKQIYYNRWGDAPVRWLAVHMLLSDEEIWCVKDIAYLHKDWLRNYGKIDGELFNSIPDFLKKWIAMADKDAK
jgi:hypothetical protein